jgi:predicted DNA binding protein
MMRSSYRNARDITAVLEAVLQCPQPHRWIELASTGYAATVEILDSKLLPDDAVQHLFEIQVKPELTNEVVTAIRGDQDVFEMEVLRSKSGHIYGSASSHRCTVCKQVAKSRCFLESVGITSKGALWTVLGNNDSFRELLRTLEKEKVPVEVKMRRNLEDTKLLTARQEQILSIAFERGFFDFPKKIGLKELASQTGVRTSTLAEILRRGQKKILGEYLARRSLLKERE